MHFFFTALTYNSNLLNPLTTGITTNSKQVMAGPLCYFRVVYRSLAHMVTNSAV